MNSQGLLPQIGFLVRCLSNLWLVLSAVCAFNVCLARLCVCLCVYIYIYNIYKRVPSAPLPLLWGACCATRELVGMATATWGRDRGTKSRLGMCPALPRQLGSGNMGVMRWLLLWVVGVVASVVVQRVSWRTTH